MDPNNIETEAPESARDITERVFDELEQAAGDDQGGGLEADVGAEGELAGDEQLDERDGDARSRDEHGRFAKERRPEKPPEKKGKPASTSGDVGRAKAGGAERAAPASPAAPVEPGAAAAAAAAARAPQSWKPQARETWTQIPPAAQEEILRVHRETSRVLQENAQLRQSAGAFQEAVRPYEAQIRAAGGEPVRYMGELLQTAHALTYAPAHQKADLLASLVMQFGPDLLRPDRVDGNGVQSCPLDRALVARMQGLAPANQPMSRVGAELPAANQAYRDPRVDQLFQQLETAKTQRQQAAQAEFEERATAFAASHEFYDDVAMEMANVLDVWGKQGKREVGNEDLERAYHLACQMHPDVAPVYEQRRAAQAAQKARASTARARAAAASLPSRGAPEAPRERGKLSARQVTEQAWDDLEGRV